MAKLVVVLVFLCVLSVRPVSTEEDPWKDDHDTIVLDVNNFHEEVAKHPIIMVEFYTPFCGHCRQFAPDYARAATRLKNEFGIPLAKMNVETEESATFAAEKYGVQGFPTIRIFKKMFDSQDPLGTLERYDEQSREADDIVMYMSDLGSPPKELEGEQIHEIAEIATTYTDKKVSVVVLGVFEDSESKAAQAFRQAKFGRKSPPLFVWTKNFETAKKYLPEGFAGKDAIVLITKFTEDEKGPYYMVPTEDVEDPLKIVEFIDIYGGPLVWKYTNELSSTILGGRLQKFIWAFVRKDSEHWAKWETALTDVAKATRGEMKYVLVSEDNDSILNYFKIDIDDLPQAMLIDLHPEVGQRQFKLGKMSKKTKEWNTTMAKNVSEAVLLKFLGQYKANKLKRFLRSEPVPTKQTGMIRKVVSNTFEDIIRSGQDVIMNFYGDFSWCKHCELFAAEWDLVATAFKDLDTLIVADFNFGLNDIEDGKKRGINPTGFPSVMLFRAGEHHLPPIVFNPADYGGERGLPRITEFLQKYAAHPFLLNDVKFAGKSRQELGIHHVEL